MADTVVRAARRLAVALRTQRGIPEGKREEEAEVELAAALSMLLEEGVDAGPVVGVLLHTGGERAGSPVVEDLLDLIQGERASDVALELYCELTSDARPPPGRRRVAPGVRRPVPKRAPRWYEDDTPAVTSPVARGWSCSACEVMNPGGMLRCSACGSPRPELARIVARRQPSPPLEWTCFACTLSNPYGATACFMCNTPKGERAASTTPAPDPQQECAICMTAHAVSTMMSLECDHRFCFDCMRSYVDAKIMVGQVRDEQLGCPTPGCRQPLTPYEVEGCTTPDMHAKYLYFRTKAALDTEQFCACPKGCGEYMERAAGDGTQFVNCSNAQCRFQFCVKCLQAAHLTTTCEEAAAMRAPAGDDHDKLFVRRMLDEGNRRCPSCGVWCEKRLDDGGCDHMSCPMCKTDFCYVCGVQRGPILAHGNHYHRPSCRYHGPCCDRNCLRGARRHGKVCVRDKRDVGCVMCERVGALCLPPMDAPREDAEDGGGMVAPRRGEEAPRRVEAPRRRPQPRRAEEPRRRFELPAWADPFAGLDWPAGGAGAGEDPITRANVVFNLESLVSPIAGVHLPNRRTMVRTVPHGRATCYALGSEGYTAGIIRWKVKIVVDEGSSTCLGVTRWPAWCSDTAFPFNQRNSMWFFRSFGGKMYAQGVELPTSVAPFKHSGCILELELNKDDGTLGIAVDGVWQPHRISGITGRVYPLVLYYSELKKETQFLRY